MRTVTTKIACGILALSSASLIASTPLFEQPPKDNLHLTGGFRQDELKWDISQSDFNRDSFSKVRWKEVKIAEITGWWDHSSPSNYYIRLNGGYGKILGGDGTVQNFTSGLLATDIFDTSASSASTSSTDTVSSSTSSSGGDNISFSRQSFDGGRGYVYDFTGGIGWGVVSGGGRSRISGLAGWSFHCQHLKAFDFKQTKDPLDLVGIGLLPGLSGRYRANWSGPFVGVDLTAEIDCNITLWGSAEWHWARFIGRGSWEYQNLYKAEFRHHTQGYGVVAHLGFDWAPCDRWGFGLSGAFQQWSSKQGTNDAFISLDNTDGFINPTFPVVEDSKLRRVKWFSYSVSAIASYRW